MGQYPRIFIVFLLVILLFGACTNQQNTEQTTSSGDEAQRDDYHFTVIFYGVPGNPFWAKVVYGAKETAEKLGCTLDFQYARNDPVRQNDIIETAIANKVDGLAMSINIDDAYDEIVERALNEGIAVIAFNNDDSQGAEGNMRMAFIGQNEEEAGYLIANRLLDVANLKEDDHVVCPVEHPQAVYATQRYTGIRRVLEPAGITSEVLETGAISLENALNQLTQYLLGHKETDAILTMGGIPLEVAPQAAEDAGRDIPIAGFDVSKVIAESIRDGRTIATVEQKPFYQGCFTVLQLYYYKKYGLLPCDIDTGGEIIDQTNVEKLIELADTVR